MTEERKYRDKEIRKILDLAISGNTIPTAPTAPTAPPDGLTLAQLQDVGREIGLDPERVATAAMEVEQHGEVLPRKTTLGMPTSVGRTIELPRAITDHEWDLLVSEFRTTFGAKGEVTSHGGIREWSNGNLHAFVEPTKTGHRLRLTTDVKAETLAVNMLGGFGLLFALMILIVLLGKADPGARFVVPIFFAIISGGALASNVMRLPRWATEREQQMENIARRVHVLIEGPNLHEHE